MQLFIGNIRNTHFPCQHLFALVPYKNHEISHQNMVKHREAEGWGGGGGPEGSKVFQSRTSVVQIEHNSAKFGQKLFSYCLDI